MFFKKDHSEGAGSPEMDAKIERSVAEHINELHEQLDERIQKQIQGDRAFVKDTVGVAFRVAGAAVALVVIVLGAWGWKTFGDIYNAMLGAASKTASDQFSSREGKQIIDATLDRSVLNSYLIQIALLKTDNSQRFRIEDFDADRLLRVVKNTDTDDVTFESAAKILITALARGGKSNLRISMISDVDETFASFITAKDKGDKWIANNYEKRVWLLNELNETGFSHDLVKTAYRDLLDTSAQADLRRAALRNVGRVRDREALSKLVQIATTSNELHLDALVTIAQIEADNKLIADWVSGLDKLATPSSDEIVAGLKISASLYKSRRDAAIKLIQFAVRHSVLMTRHRLVTTTENAPLEDVYVIPLSELDNIKIVQGFSPTPTLVQGERWAGAVTELLEKLASQADLTDFRALVTWLTPMDEMELRFKQNFQRPVWFVVASMSQDATILLEGGGKVDRSSAPKGVLIEPDRLWRQGPGAEKAKLPSTRVLVTGSEDTKSGSRALIGFTNPRGLTFGVRH